MTILETKDLRKIYGAGETEVRALDGVDLSVEKGEFVAVVGTSGSGKSTLLHLVGGLDTPTSGTVTVRGQALDAMSDEQLTIFRRRNIGFVFQHYNLVPMLNVYENIVLPVELDGETPDPAFLQEVVGMLGLEEKLTSMPHQLSGGQQQRVAIARALAMKPDILCFGEPTSALDPELTGEVLRVIRGLADQHTTMIIVTHEMSFARDVADQVIFMDGGVGVEEGTPEAVFGNPQQERTRQFLEKYRGD